MMIQKINMLCLVEKKKPIDITPIQYIGYYTWFVILREWFDSTSRLVVLKKALVGWRNNNKYSISMPKICPIVYKGQKGYIIYKGKKIEFTNQSGWVFQPPIEGQFNQKNTCLQNMSQGSIASTLCDNPYRCLRCNRALRLVYKYLEPTKTVNCRGGSRKPILLL